MACCSCTVCFGHRRGRNGFSSGVSWYMIYRSLELPQSAASSSVPFVQKVFPCFITAHIVHDTKPRLVTTRKMLQYFITILGTPGVPRITPVVTGSQRDKQGFVRAKEEAKETRERGRVLRRGSGRNENPTSWYCCSGIALESRLWYIFCDVGSKRILVVSRDGCSVAYS